MGAVACDFQSGAEGPLKNPLLEKAIELAGDAIIIIDKDERVVWTNLEFERQSGFRFRDLSGVSIAEIFTSSSKNLSYKSFCSLKESSIFGGGWKRYLCVRRADGSAYRAEEVTTVMRDGSGAVENYVSVLHDLTYADHALHLERLSAGRDSLTGLAGRAQVLSALESGLRSAQNANEMLALLFLDLDGFKTINDCHGHMVGDALLRAVGARLQGVVRCSDTIGRFGGDEFVVVLPSIARRGTAREVGRKLVDQMTQPFSLQSGCYRIGGSVGLAFFPDHGSDAETLLACADEAMYTAKRQGGRQMAICDPDIEAAGRRTISPHELPALLSKDFASDGVDRAGALLSEKK
ncbi:diguanylate cyclase domain-containing protein [Massilia sp. DWR3-1-1]|uniref:PAS domain-containing protein n=1 Tax=Massilia sp. DWR3-1-1 TaxID=2804559 RepID=UPI003CED5D8C